MGKRSNGTRSQSPLQAASTRTNSSKIGGSNTGGKSGGAANTQAGNTYTTSSGKVYEYGHLFSKKEESRIAAEIDSVKKALNLGGLRETTTSASYEDVSKAISSKGLKLDDLNRKRKESLAILERDYSHGQNNVKGLIKESKEVISKSIKTPYYKMTVYVSPRVEHVVSVKPYIYNGKKQEYEVSITVSKTDSKGRYISTKTEESIIDKDQMLKKFKKYNGKKYSNFG
jgi:hypothetical protein